MIFTVGLTLFICKEGSDSTLDKMSGLSLIGPEGCLMYISLKAGLVAVRRGGAGFQGV